ncbi:ribosomal protein S18-alanine N-acetyltransferase [Desulfolithobacter sp.]
MSVRPMRAGDVPPVVAIEEAVMDTPWSRSLVEAELQGGSGIRLVFELHGQVAGYVFFRFCGPEAELLRIAVREQSRRLGIGSTLLSAGVAALRCHHGVISCFLEVRSANRTALRFYAKEGFVEVGRRPGYYRQPSDDALILGLEIRDE